MRRAGRTGRTARARLTLAAAAVLAALSGTALADGMIIPRPDPRPRPRPLVPPAIRYHKVKTAITGRVATTYVDQVFHNPNARPMEGDYIFPIPERAVISRFTLDIDGKEVEAELLDAEKARRIYEDIVRRMKDPALLEYAGRGIFRARIFPIPPNGGRRITLKYEEEVPRTGGLFRYRYPLNTEKFSSRDIEEVTVDVTITSERPVRSVVCPSHPGEAVVKRTDRGAASVSLVQRHVRPDRDFVVYYGLGGELSVDVVAHRESSGDTGYFMLAISPPAERRGPRARPKDLVLVIDTSGSMAGDKLDQVKNALKYCLNSLSPEDRFNVVRFSTEAEAFREGLIQASRGNVRGALQFVDGFIARGGTAIEEALELAIGSPSNRAEADRPSVGPRRSRAQAARPLMIAFLTDGKPTIGERDPDAIVRSAEKKLGRKGRVFVFGVGNDLNTRLLDRLAEVGRGSRTYVAPGEDVEVAVSSFYDRIASPVLTDLRLKFAQDLDVRDVYPKDLGDLFHGDEIIVYGRYGGGYGRSRVTLAGRTEAGEKRFAFDVEFPAEEPANGFVARLWAVRKIGYLLDEIRLHGESAELKQEVVRLAREFGILTPYTSMLVIEDEESGRRPGRPDEGLRRMLKAGPESAVRREAMKGRATSGAPAVEASKAFDMMQQGVMSEADAAGGLREKARDLVRRLENKTFYLRHGVWTDSAVDPKAARTVVKYLSDEYFELLRAKPRIGRYLALGERVVVAFGGRTYEIAP
jgi:Ca-activated chloride channel family protein